MYFSNFLVIDVLVTASGIIPMWMPDGYIDENSTLLLAMLVPSGDKPLPWPMLKKTHNPTWHDAIKFSRNTVIITVMSFSAYWNYIIHLTVRRYVSEGKDKVLKLLNLIFCRNWFTTFPVKEHFFCFCFRRINPKLYYNLTKIVLYV